MKMQPKNHASYGQKGRCFVLMPFRRDLDDIYALIKNVCAQLGLKCWRAHEVSRAGNVFGMILEDTKQADVGLTVDIKAQAGAAAVITHKRVL
jgi:hypothetical protein